MNNQQIQQISSSEQYDQEWKYLFNTQTKVEKNNNTLNFMSNVRFLLVENNIISYKNTLNDIWKKQVKVEDCERIEFINNDDFILQVQFEEIYCLTNSIQSKANSQKKITWRFVVKDQQGKEKLKQKLEHYKLWNTYFQKYLEINTKGQELFKQFYKDCMSLTSKNQVIEGQNIPKVTRIHQQDEQLQTFKSYRKLFSIIQISQFEKSIIPPLKVIIIANNHKYLCELDILDSKMDQVNNDLIQNDWEQFKEQNLIEQEFLNQFELKTYQTKFNQKVRNFGILYKTKFNTIKQQIDNFAFQQQLKILEQQEIYDSLKFSQCIHANKFKISQIGAIANQTKNQDLKKICKAEILARTAKQHFRDNRLDQNEDEEKDKIQLQKFVSLFWALYDKEQNRNKIFQKTKLSFEYEIIENDFEKIDVLLFNSLMFHLNFFAPINIPALLEKKKRFLSCIDLQNIKLLGKYKTYEEVKQMELDNCEILNYSFIKSFANQNLQSEPNKCFLLAKILMGQKNLIFVQLLVQQFNKDQIFLIRARECLKSVFSNSIKCQEIEKKLSVPSFILNQQQFNTECKSVLSSIQRSILVTEVSSLIMFDESSFDISKIFSDRDLYQEANKKFFKKRYAEAHKILEAVKDKNDFEILKLGFDVELKLDLTTYLYQSRFLNYIFLYRDFSIEKDLIKDILIAAGRRYLKTCTQFEIEVYNKIFANFKEHCQQQLNLKQFIFSIKQQLFDEKFATLEEFIYQQFDYFENHINQIYIMSPTEIGEMCSNLMADENFLLANQYFSILF